MNKVARTKYHGLGLSVLGPSYEEILEEARQNGPYRAGEPLVLFADDAKAPHSPWPGEKIKNERDYKNYMAKVALIFAEEGFIAGDAQKDPHLAIQVYLFPPDGGGEPYAEWEGEIRAEETLARIDIEGNRWRAKGKVVTRLGDPVGIYVGKYNPEWEWGRGREWIPLTDPTELPAWSLEKVVDKAQALLKSVEEELDPNEEYAIVTYVPQRLPGNYYFRPLAPCTVAEARLTRRRGRKS